MNLNLNIRPETVKLIEEKLFGIESGDFKRNKSKDQAGLHPKLLYSKENHPQNETATYVMGENICKSCV